MTIIFKWQSFPFLVALVTSWCCFICQPLAAENAPITLTETPTWYDYPTKLEPGAKRYYASGMMFTGRWYWTLIFREDIFNPEEPDSILPYSRRHIRELMAITAVDSITRQKACISFRKPVVFKAESSLNFTATADDEICFTFPQEDHRAEGLHWIVTVSLSNQSIRSELAQKQDAERRFHFKSVGIRTTKNLEPRLSQDQASPDGSTQKLLTSEINLYQASGETIVYPGGRANRIRKLNVFPNNRFSLVESDVITNGRQYSQISEESLIHFLPATRNTTRIVSLLFAHQPISPVPRITFAAEAIQVTGVKPNERIVKSLTKLFALEDGQLGELWSFDKDVAASTISCVNSSENDQFAVFAFTYHETVGSTESANYVVDLDKGQSWILPAWEGKWQGMGGYLNGVTNTGEAIFDMGNACVVQSASGEPREVFRPIRVNKRRSYELPSGRIGW